MYEYLRAHPDIFVSPIKELHYFSMDVFDDYRPYGPRTLEEYTNCFKGAIREKRIAECSPTYLGSPSAPRKIKAFMPEARIIIMLRNPVDVMYALHSQHLWDTTESIKDFGAALEADRRHSATGIRRLPGLSYRDTVRYSIQVRRYLEVFGHARTFIVIFDDFEANPALVYRDTLRFLDVNPTVTITPSIVNANHAPRNYRLQRLLVQRFSHFARIFPKQFQRSVGRTLLKLNTMNLPRPLINTRLKIELLQDILPEVEELSCLLGRDLTHWSRDI